MVLESKSPSIHNLLQRGDHVVMTSTSKKIPHPASTRYNESDTSNIDFPLPSGKRRKIEEDSGGNSILLQKLAATDGSEFGGSDGGALQSPRKNKQRGEVVELEDENAHGNEHEDGHTATQLEAALPIVQTDQEAIEAYEAYKAGQAEGAQDTLQSRLDNMTWTRGKSSIYVDAFNLALETVLEQEGHLFNEAEQAVFKYWNELDYEAQYLYVRLFLRKTSAWHRIGKLGYYSDISDMDNAVVELQKERDLPKVEEGVEAFPGEAVLPEEAVPLGRSFKFAECSENHISTLDEASSLLLLDELKVIAKEAKVQGKNKRELLQNLRRTSGKQKGLGFKRSDTEETVSSVGDDESVADDEDGSSSGVRTPTFKGNRDAHLIQSYSTPPQNHRKFQIFLSPRFK